MNYELLEQALHSGNEAAIRLAHSMLKDPSNYKDDPVGYAENVLGISTLWSKQKEVLEALVKHRRVMVESSNGIGKSFLAAIATLWFHDTRKGIALCSAPTARQIDKITFKELRRFYKGNDMMPKQSLIYRDHDDFVAGFTATEATSFQGHHAEAIFILFEEATAIDADIWTAAESCIIGGEDTYFLAILNPTDTASQAYIERESGRWHVIHISSFDHPNIALELDGKPPLIPGAVRLEALRDLIGKWCEPVKDDRQETDFEFEGNVYRPGPLAQSRLLGIYPTSGTYSIFSDQDFRNSLIPLDPEGPEIEIGSDCARFGDDATTVTVKRGCTLLHHESWNKRDLDFTAQRLKELAIKYAIGDPSKVEIRIDSSGIGGGLGSHKGEFNFIEINAASKAHEPLNYPNKRSELLFTLADKMKRGYVSFANLPKETFAELRRQALSVLYKIDNQGRRVAEKKEDHKKKIGRSPDDLDSVALAYCGRSPLFNLTTVFDKMVDEHNKRIDTNKEKIMPNAVLEYYKGVRALSGLGTYQARCTIRGVEAGIYDNPNQHLVAYAVNVAFTHLGQPEPNVIHVQLTDEQKKNVETSVLQEMKKRKVERVKPEVKEKKASKASS